MVHLLAITWQPGLQGLVDLAIAMAVFLGTILILLAVNNGIRLGFLLGLTGLFGWLTFMFGFWMMFPIAYKGPAPSWKIKEVSYDLAQADTAAARDVPNITSLPSAQSLIAEHHLQSDFKTEKTTPTLGEVIAADPAVEDELEPKLNGWKLLSSGDKDASDSATAASNYLIGDGKVFPDTQHFVVLGAFGRGGKPPLGNTGMWNRITHKVESVAMWVVDDNPAHYAVVQVQASNYVEPAPGQKPPTPEAKPGAPVISVVMVRDNGAVRLPAFALFVVSLIIFGICLNSLHRRDKMGMAARAAAAAPPPGDGADGTSTNGTNGAAAGRAPPGKKPESAGVR